MDRASFKLYLRLKKSDKVPDRKTFWLFREQLIEKDVDIRWTKKNNATFYGYKNHVNSDKTTKLIEEYIVTAASVHDSQAKEELLIEKDEGQPFYADSAYTGKDQGKIYDKKKVINKVIEKDYCNKPPIFVVVFN